MASNEDGHEFVEVDLVASECAITDTSEATSITSLVTGGFVADGNRVEAVDKLETLSISEPVVNVNCDIIGKSITLTSPTAAGRDDLSQSNCCQYVDSYSESSPEGNVMHVSSTDSQIDNQISNANSFGAENNSCGDRTSTSAMINYLTACDTFVTNPDDNFGGMTADDVLKQYDVLEMQVKKLTSAEQAWRAEQKTLYEELERITAERDDYKMKCENDKTVDDHEINELRSRIQELEGQIQQNHIQWKAAHDKWVEQDSTIKTTIAQLTKSRDDCRRDKEMIVMKYALAEQKNIELCDKIRKLETTVSELTTEKDNLMTYLNTMRTEKQKLKEITDKKVVEAMAAKQELEKQRELTAAQELKTKWYINQLNIETESHKESRNQLSKLEREIQEMREENEKMKCDQQKAIRTCQESLVMKTITNEMELKETKQELETNRQESSDQLQLHTVVRLELDTLKAKHKEMLEELHTYKDKVRCLEDERLLQEQFLNDLRDCSKLQQLKTDDLQKKLSELEGTEQKFIQLSTEVNDLELERRELTSELSLSASRESEHLSYIANLSDQITLLQTKNTDFENQVKHLTSENQCLTGRCQSLDRDLAAQTEKLNSYQQTTSIEIDKLQQQLMEVTRLGEERQKLLDDKEDELKTLKRRHAASSKELTRQLGQLQKRVDMANTTTNGNSSSGRGNITSPVVNVDQSVPLSSPVYNSSKSRTENLLSLSGSNQSTNGTSDHNSDHMSGSSTPMSETEGYCSAIGSKVSTERLIAKIVQLQTTNISLSNKLEFMQDHVRQLTEELRNKSRIIQDYVLREENYSLRPATSAQHSSKPKNLLAAVLPSGVTSWKQQEDSTAALAGEQMINEQLQAVVEDVLLKNVQQKENADRLTEEISRLRQQNAQLKVQISDLTNRV